MQRILRVTQQSKGTKSMDMEVRFPRQNRLTRGRNGSAETSGIWMSDGCGVVELYPITGKGDRSEAARLVVPFTHLRDFRDALNDMLTHVEAIEGKRRAVAMGDISVLDLLVDGEDS